MLREASRVRWSEEINGASKFNIYNSSEILVLRSMEKVISKRDDSVVDTLFYFEPMQKLEYRGDMFKSDQIKYV